MTERKYEIGRWYPHDGGPCPVPEGAIVEYVWHYEDCGECGIVERIAGDDGNGTTPSWGDILKFRVTEYPNEEETRTGECWAYHYKSCAPTLAETEVGERCAKGTYTATIVNGRPKRIVWEADNE